MANTLALEVRPLRASLGAAIHGVDLRKPLTPELRTAIHDAWMRHMVLVFPSQPISDEQHIAFSRNFGTLEVFPRKENQAAALPEILRVANTDEQGRHLPPQHDQVRYFTLAEEWHTDSCYREMPSNGAILHGIETTTEGGQTWFINLAEVYDALPPDLRARVEGRRAVHSFAYARSLRNMPAMAPEEAAKVPPIAHPLVRRHPVTGRKSLYISMCYMTEVIGLGEAESRVLFRELEAFATQDRFIYKHRWTPHDILMWDNRCTMHAVTPYDAAKHRRVMHRTSIAGDSLVIAA